MARELSGPVQPRRRHFLNVRPVKRVYIKEVDIYLHIYLVVLDMESPPSEHSRSSKFRVSNMALQLLIIPWLVSMFGLPLWVHGKPSPSTGGTVIEDTYDFVIIGGGTSGLTVGDRLSESGTCRCRNYLT